MVIVLWPQYREKIAQHMLRAIAVLHFPIYALKSCPAPAALAAGAGHYFSLTAYNLTFKPPYRGKGLKKKTYLEIFQSNIVKYTTNRYVDCNAVSWFSICRQTRQDSCTIPYLIPVIFVALCLHWRSIDFTHSSVSHFGFTV